MAILCWLEGGKNVLNTQGCGGYNSWLYSCCLQNSQNKLRSSASHPPPPPQAIPPSLPKRKRNNPPLVVERTRHQPIQKKFSRRRYDTSLSESNHLSPPPNCGIPRTPSSTLQKRIIGGRPAYFAEYPWQAHIRIKEFQCGGALVSRRFVVTAGHCISRAKLRDIVVYLGELDTQDSGLIFEPLPAEKHTVIQKFIHPKFRFRLTQPDRFDVAALKLKKPAGYK